MKYKKPVVGVFFLIYSFSVVFADNASEFEKELQRDPPGIGYSPDAVSVYSKIRNKVIKDAVDAQHKKSRSDPYLKLNKDGIKVYIYKRKNSDFGMFKAISHINATLDSVLAVLLDNKSCTEWVDSCEKSFVIKRLSFYEQYHYQILSIPVPFTNRDFIFHSKMAHNPSSKTIIITMTSVPDYCSSRQSEQCTIVNQSNLVRVKKSIGTFKLEPDKKGTKITWIQHIEPAGHLPAWLVNQFMKNTPYHTFKSLAKIVKQEHYKKSRLIYDQMGLIYALKK